ncbi:hypothetical protein [Vibrio agarivorans]|uniref:hypothetical protein n=1 Tax=Vibrio agarivorans TaxID=153622 RepID=UPI0025B47CFB|nr:hypothetical protein [Vibrio agarivorans]MDN3661061.1 hypothetical protein [Vibrio agarivorans]
MMSGTQAPSPEILPKQRWVVIGLISATAVLPFLGLAPFVFLLLCLFFIRRSFKKYDEARGLNAIQRYSKALLSLTTRTFIGVISVTLLLIHQASQSSVTAEPINLEVFWVFVGFGLVALLHYLSLISLSFKLYRNRFEVDGTYLGLLNSIINIGRKVVSTFSKKVRK